MYIHIYTCTCTSTHTLCICTSTHTLVHIYMYIVYIQHTLCIFAVTMSGDSRKDFILATIGNHFGYSISDGAIAHIHTSNEVNTFLDDGNSLIKHHSQDSVKFDEMLC